MSAERALSELTKQEARDELAYLAGVLAKANTDYHTDDAPTRSDADYDKLKRRNADIESQFPDLKRSDSPSDQVGAPVSGAFSKIEHKVRMLSLGNAFTDEDVI